MINSLKETKTYKATLLFPIILLIIWLGINFNATQSYLTNLETNRNLALADKTWSTLKGYVPELEKDTQNIFYFTYDNSIAANMVLIFGFWPHAGLEYEIQNWENTPLPTENYQELLEIVKTGEPLNKIHARKAIPMPLSIVDAFDLRNDELINIFDEIRKKISQDLIPTQ